MRSIELLRKNADDLGTCGVGESLELLQVFIERLACPRTLERGADEECPLRRRGDVDQDA